MFETATWRLHNRRAFAVVRFSVIAVVSLAAAFAWSCGEGDTTTIIKEPKTVTETTTVTNATAASPEASGATATTSKPEEYSGPCSPRFNLPEGANAGYENLETLAADCDYAHTVATAWVRDYGPDCYEGCRKTVENIGCEYEPGTSTITCLAASTEVRWEIVFLEGS
jgi:hypothetical protein